MRSSIRGAVGAAIALFAALVLVTLSPAVASAAECEVDPDYAGSVTITVAPAGPVTPGETITITGTGFPPGCEVTLTVDGVVVGTATTDAAGSFTFGYTLGSSISGSVSVGVSAGGFSRAVMLEVAGSTPPPTTATTVTTTTTGSLPRTGSDAGRMAGVALALVAAGGLVVLATRRRGATTGA